MVITEVRIKLVAENNERLMAFCSLTLDNAFVIRDLKIIDGTKGLFVAMPSRKLTDRCPRCGSKNHLRARHCNSCGGPLDENRAPRDHDGRAKLHADIAHPINSTCREVMQAAILRAFADERDRAKQPGYVCTYDDFDVDYDTPLGQVVGEGHSRPVRGYRTHSSHSSRGQHARQEATASQEKGNGNFGAGIL